ncbi:MAG: biotin/lipoyl-binding protein [Planctomycetes bacterium]|nr:biotin/lipoyl-binding protein [Planctomycetota bacterium]
MHYTVDVGGESLELRVEQGPSGLAVALGEGPLEEARWVQVSGTLYSLEWGSRRARVRVEPDPMEPGGFRVTLPGKTPLSLLPVDERTRAASAGRDANAPKGPGVLRSAMPGVIVEIHVAEGDRVEAGQVLLILEAMKMQNEIKATVGGSIASVFVSAGDTVPAGEKLVEFAAEPEPTA